MLIAADTVRSELEAWRDSIAVDSCTQDDALYRPSQVMDFSCTLALIAAGIAEPDPFACTRIEVRVDRFTDDGRHRACSSVDATPRLFAGSRGLLRDWTSGRNSVGALAPDEWAERRIAVVWWRPHDEDLRYQYVETEPGAPIRLGVETKAKWEIPYRPVFGPPIPNNHCDPPALDPTALALGPRCRPPARLTRRRRKLPEQLTRRLREPPRQGRTLRVQGRGQQAPADGGRHLRQGDSR